jgi:hypothetical protein
MHTNYTENLCLFPEIENSRFPSSFQEIAQQFVFIAIIVPYPVGVEAMVDKGFFASLGRVKPRGGMWGTDPS